MAHRADSIKEPSYNTLANLAEILGATIYNSPALASTNKLDEAGAPTAPKIDMGIIVGRIDTDHGVAYNVRLNSGAQVTADSLTGNRYHEDYAVCVAQETSGNYVILSGGDVDNKTEYGNQIIQTAMAYSSYITGREGKLERNNTFQAFDTNSLINIILELHYHILNLESRFNKHVHAVPNGVSETPKLDPALSPAEIEKLKSYDVKEFTDRYNTYINSHTPKFQIIY